MKTVSRRGARCTPSDDARPPMLYGQCLDQDMKRRLDQDKFNNPAWINASIRANGVRPYN